MKITVVTLITLVIFGMVGIAKSDYWADAVVESSDVLSGDPENALGPPCPGSVPADWYNYAVRIDSQGSLILDMGLGQEISDIPGHDFRVEEVDAEDGPFSNDPYEVWVSNDPTTFVYYLGDGDGDTRFDIGSSGLSQARYVKLVGKGVHDFEIDAVGLLAVGCPDGWWVGNTHTHSKHDEAVEIGSDGCISPSEVASHYKVLGYNFLVLTDHSSKQSSLADIAQYSDLDSDFLCIKGEEIQYGSSRRHTNGIGLTNHIDGAGPFSVYDPELFEQNIQNILNDGGIAQVNHPTWTWETTSGDIEDIVNCLNGVDNLKFMEIYNAEVQRNDDEAIWDLLLSGGKLVYGIASDDFHHKYVPGETCSMSGHGAHIPQDRDDAGHAWIVVRASELTRENILGAMNVGDFYASTGVILNDYMVDENRMVVDSMNGDSIQFIGKDGVELGSPVMGSSAEYIFKGDEGYVRAKISKNDDTYAWCQPVFVPAFVTVFIDIKSGSDLNSINLGSRGVTSVAILSSTNFDATQVDPVSVSLSGAGVAIKGKRSNILADIEDVNEDGLPDLVIKVETEDINPDQFLNGKAILTGETYNGQKIKGYDSIRIVPSRAAPARFALLQNYPNSFNPDTWIPYQLGEDADITIRIYDVSGQLVRTLDLGHKPSGSYTDRSKSAYWDGNNEAGEQVASGVYFYTIQAGEFTATKKMIMAK